MGENNLTEGSVWKNLIRFALPYLLACFMQTFYGMADLFVVGLYNGSKTTTAVAIGSQVMHMLTVIIVGFAMGATVRIGRYVGAKDERAAAKTVGASVVFFAAFAVLLTVALMLCTNLITSVMLTPAEALEETSLYLGICFAGVPFITAYNVISSIFRGAGDSKRPMYFVGVACVVNIALDFVLIGGLSMGAAGAALGTVLGQAVSVAFAFVMLKQRDLGFQVTGRDIRADRETISQILRVGAPIACQDGLIQVAFIVITVIAATAVIGGSLSLGMMLAIQYIIGQLNAPVEQFVQFLYSWQDVKISLERMSEIHDREEEETPERMITGFDGSDRDIEIRNVTFQYEGIHSPKVLERINLKIPRGKITAIVGTSGSGKTTLIKLLLGYYNPVEGDIRVGGNDLRSFSLLWWRDQCGAVMQDGYLFSESIARNIAVDDGEIDKSRLLLAARIANIEEFIERLPLKYNTVIGLDGQGVSQGQRQRILIARAVYKDPSYLFFDEATNSLDANNERAIVENLTDFYRGKTVIIVAHRLSTVRNADQIVVLDRGRIVEVDSHEELIKRNGAYYNLVKNQLELGN